MSSILVVDDSKSMRQMITVTLNQVGHKITLAEDGQQALDIINKRQFDLVLTDINMPVMDGITFLKEARQLQDYQYTPMLVLTTEFSDEKKNEGRQAGATGWIVKPFDPDKLLSLVARVIN